MSILSSGPVSAPVPEVRILDLPFLFQSYGHAHRTLDGPIGDSLLRKFEPKGVIALTWAEHGFRHLTNNKRPIVYPEDMKELRIRTMENPVHVASMKALKAKATPMAFTDLPDALRAGLLDGQENPITVILTSRLYETQKYLSLTHHFYSAAVILMSRKVWSGLSESEQGVVTIAAKNAARATRRRVALDEINYVDQLKRAGMQVNIFVDGPSFRRLLRDQYFQLNPDVDRKMLDMIQSSY